MQNEKTFINPDDAFNYAISKGLLNTDRDSPWYAGKWMYMNSDHGTHSFKNVKSRTYIQINIE